MAQFENARRETASVTTHLGYRFSYLHAALVMAVMLAVVPPLPLRAQWAETEFVVHAYGRSGYSLDPTVPFLAVGDMIMTAGDTAELRLRHEMEVYLYEAAQRLAEWGFPEPELGLPGQMGPYEVFLVDEIQGASGKYHPDHCFGPGISSRAILIDRGETTWIDSAGSPQVRPFGYEALGHELFHAVQHAMGFFESRCDGRVGDWITEGTARAVGGDLVRKIGPPWDPQWGNRGYDRPLPVPLRLSLLPGNAQLSSVDAYETSSFWRYLAEMHMRQGGFPGIGPEEDIHYGYLIRMFGDPVARDCNSEGAECSAELQWLDGWLIRQFGRSLKQLFPLFIETLGMYGERGGRARDAFGNPEAASNWRNQVFLDGCSVVRFEPGRPRTVRTVVARFHPNAARCWQVTTETLSDEAQLSISAIGPRGAPSLSHLSIATGGRPVRADSADTIVFTEEKTQADWTLPANDTVMVFMTNVAPDPTESELMTNLPVVFTLIEPFAAIVSVSTSPGGPSAADIDQPIGIQLDRGLEAVIADRIPRGNTIPTGMAEPCFLFTPGLRKGRQDVGDLVGFELYHDGPILPGEYPVAPSDARKPGNTPPVGMAVVAFALGPANHTLVGGHLQSFIGNAGLLTINSMSGGFVQGVLEVSGENQLAAETRWRGVEMTGMWAPPPTYVPNMSIRVEFSLPLRDLFQRNTARNRCLDVGEV